MGILTLFFSFCCKTVLAGLLHLPLCRKFGISLLVSTKNPAEVLTGLDQIHGKSQGNRRLTKCGPALCKNSVYLQSPGASALETGSHWSLMKVEPQMWVSVDPDHWAEWNLGSRGCFRHGEELN